MRKHSKFITILLFALLAVCLVQTVFVQAFATEMGDDDFGWGNASTSDEAETVYPVSMEVVKAPESVTVNNGRITDSTFWSNVVLHIVYSNGEEYDVNCDGIEDNEDGIVPPIAEINGYAGSIYAYYDLGDDGDDFTFTVYYDYASPEDEWGNSHDYWISAEYSVKKVKADTVYPVSMKVVKAPESVTVRNDEITDSTFWSKVVLHIVYSNGKEYDVNCDGIEDSEDGIVPPIAEIDGYAGRINVEPYDTWTDTVDFTVDYSYASYDWSDNSISAKFSVKPVADPHSITRLEVTKLPDKVFTKPLYTGSLDDISAEDWDKWMNSLDVNNSISNHLDGMELTFYYANGEKGSVVVNSSNLEIGNNSPLWAHYVVANVDEYGNPLYFNVRDEGDYKFSISLNNESDATVYTAKSADNPNPSLKPVSTEDTPAKPAKPSGNVSSATSDVATNDNANTNNGTNGTANNGVVATGDFATPAIIATVMILAAAVMFVFKRKRMF